MIGLNIESKDSNRPPYVTFDYVQEEDRDASLKQGNYVARDVPYAYITPPGSRDRLVKRVDDWFDTLEYQVQQGRFPREWRDAFKVSFEAWKNQQEIPANGTPVKNWSVVSPAQVKRMLELNVRTVEDMSQANEETLMRLGMGARELKQRAVDYLKAAAGPGKVSGEISALKTEIVNLTARNKSLEEQIAKLSASVQKE